MAEKVLPALGRGPLALYDPVMALTMRERALRGRLVAAARLAPRHDVLDLGCGTGAVARAVLEAEPTANVIGLDADPAALERARRKVPGARFDEGSATDLPYADGGFDRVVSSLLLHHLRSAAKLEALREARRVLRSGGELHVADWGRAPDPLMRMAFLGVQLLDGFATTADHAAGRLPALVAQAGFGAVDEHGLLRTPFGAVRFLRAAR